MSNHKKGARSAPFIFIQFPLKKANHPPLPLWPKLGVQKLVLQLAEQLFELEVLPDFGAAVADKKKVLLARLVHRPGK